MRCDRPSDQHTGTPLRLAFMALMTVYPNRRRGLGKRVARPNIPLPIQGIRIGYYYNSSRLDEDAAGTAK